ITPTRMGRAKKMMINRPIIVRVARIRKSSFLSLKIDELPDQTFGTAQDAFQKPPHPPADR
ncbi:MAG: hypothetical protein KJ908_07655, partial [Acidobacteria bacterium]|nr:hypothetical protein [Acidobacteriota bacterium]